MQEMMLSKLDPEGKMYVRKTGITDIDLDSEGGFFSNKKNIVRLIIFVVAVVLAAVFMANAVNQLIHKDPGWYEIQAETDKAVPHYSSGITFKYEFEGTSTHIGAETKELTGCYEDSLKYYYKLLDSENTYEGFTNIASVNASAGKEAKVGSELYEILYDAYTRSQNGGIGIFDGVFNSLRDDIVFSEQPYEDDPAVNAETSEMLAELAEISSKENAVTLTFGSDKKSVLFDLSDEYKAFLSKYGLTSPVLDLGLLHDAYLLKYTGNAISSRGFDRGYLTTESGLTLVLGGVKEISLCLYTGADEKGNPLTAASVGAKGGSAGALVRNVPIFSGEYGFYTEETDSEPVVRHRYMISFDGSTDVQSVLALNSDGDIVTAVTCALNILSADKENAALKAAECSGTELLFKLGGDNTVYSTTDKITVSSELGFRFKKIK